MVVININTEDEAVLNKLPGVTFIEARRICMARPFQNEAELLQVRGLSQNTIQQWQNGGFEIAFEDPFLAFERAQQDSALISMQSPAPSIPSPNPLTYSPAPSNSSPAPRRNSQPTPASRRPPLPRPRRPSIKTQGNGQSNQVKTPPEISEQKTKSSERKTSKESLNSTMTEVPSASSPAVEKLVALLYRQQDARLRRIAVSRMLRTVTAVIEAWRGHLQERQRCDQAEYGIILRRLRTSLHDALSEWLVYGRKANRLRKLGVRMLSRVLERVTSSAFRRWQSVCHGLSAMGATYANLLARCYTHCLMDHFEAWRDFTSHNRRQAHMMRRAASAWLHLRLRSAWNAWQMTCQTRRRLRGIALTVTYNWLHVRVGPILNAWQQHAMLAERVAMMRMRNAAARDAASLKGCLQHWRAMSSKEVVEYLQKKIIRWMMGSLSENFVAWHEHTVATRRWAIALSRAVLKMQQKLSYGTFYRWKQKLELKSKARLVLVRIMQFQLIKAMERWRRQTASEVDLKMKMEMVVIRWRSFGIRVALLRWRKQAALRRTAFHSVQRLINRGLLESFEIWRRRVGWQIQLKLKAGKAMMRLFNRLLVQGFDRWRQQVEDEIQLKRKALKVVQRMMNRELVESFDRWHWVLQRSIHLHETGIRILVASMERHLRHVFIAWQLASVRSKLWLNVQRKVMKIDTRVLYQNHFDAWRDMVGNRTRELFKLIEGWKEYRNPAGREGAMLVRILYGWRGVAKDSVQVRHAGVKVLLRWLAMGVRQSFMHWRGRADLKKQALMVVRRLMNRGLVSAFERWVTQALEEKQLRHKAFKVVHRLMNRVQVQGFERWREQAVEEKQLKLKALKVVQRMKGLWLAMALDRWKTETFMQAQDKSQSMSWQEVVLQIGLRWTTAQLSAVFRQWHNISKFLRSREIHYVRARRRIVWNCKRSTMLEWSVYTYEARRLWHAGSVILSRWTSALLTSALSGWMDCVAHDKAKLAAVTMAVAKQDVAIALPDPDCLRQAEQARENMESFSTQENRQPLDVATAIAPQADTDGWSRVIASLSTDQRIGLHMLGMHRTWQAVSSIFSAWASILKRRGSTGASHTVSADRAPLEPDFSPRQLDLGLSPQSQSHYMRADMHPHTTPQLTPADLERSAYTQTVEDNSDPQSLPYKPPPPPTPSRAALQPHGALSIYSTALHPSTSSSTVIPAVVMSNFPRQQFTPVSAEEREDSQATPRHTDTRLPLSPSVAGGGLTHFSPSKVLSPRTIVMSPPQATNCSRSSRESGDEKGAKLGQPVTQSLVMPPPRPGLQVDAQGAGDNAKNDPLIYLL